MSIRALKAIAVIVSSFLIAAILGGLYAVKAQGQPAPEPLEGQGAGRWQPHPGTSWQ